MNPPPRAWNLARTLAAGAVIVIGAGLGALYAGARQENARLRDEIARLQEVERASQQQVDSARDALQAVTDPDVQVIDATSIAPHLATARAYWNPVTGEWTLVARDLPTLAAGHVYQLWLVTTDGREVSAATFVPGADGRAVARWSRALASNRLKELLVSDEAAGGGSERRGEVVMAGRVR